MPRNPIALYEGFYGVVIVGTQRKKLWIIGRRAGEGRHEKTLLYRIFHSPTKSLSVRRHHVRLYYDGGALSKLSLDRNSIPCGHQPLWLRARSRLTDHFAQFVLILLRKIGLYYLELILLEFRQHLISHSLGHQQEQRRFTRLN